MKKENELKISLDTSFHQDEAFDELIDFFSDLCKRHCLNFYDAFGILACLKTELEKNLKKEDE